jgi:quinol monooxygenase YgiN
MSFTQTMTVQADSADELTKLMEGWHRDQKGAAPGYEGARLLADRDAPGTYVIEVDFASAEAAETNSARPETQEWAQRLRNIAQGEPAYHDYEVTYETP